MTPLWTTTLRVAALGLVWLVLAEGDLNSLPVGAVVVALAVWAAPGAVHPGHGVIRPWGAVRFVGHFLWNSLISGMEVARRALGPRLSLSPGLVRYDCSLPDEASRVFFANAVSLLPGTLTCRIEGQSLTLHVLDQVMYAPEELADLERRVAALFGVVGSDRPKSGDRSPEEGRP